MALKKLITKPNGISTEYHKIAHVGLSDRNGEHPYNSETPITIDVMVRSYLNEEYRQNGHSIEVKSYWFELTDEEEKQGIREVAYTKLKTLPEFEGAEDC